MIKVTAVGRLTKDAVVFSYGGDKTGINFAIACNQQGSDEATFINCTKFNSGENLAKYLVMGNQVIVEGNININKGQDGSYYTSIIVNELEFGAKKVGSNEYNHKNNDDEYKYMQSKGFNVHVDDYKTIDDGDIPF